MLDEFIPQIEQLQAEGALVLLKWDGERAHERCTVVVGRQSTDYIWRRDCDDIAETLRQALAAYRKAHAH